MPLKRREGPAKRTTERRERGIGSANITVKGKRATARQREVIDGILEQCAEDGASRRVMIAALMCATQESKMGELAHVVTGNDDTGIYHQGRNWTSVAGARDPRRATHAFLITGPTSWKKVHGGVKNAPGDLNAALMKVQISVGGYGPWQAECTKTVDIWLDTDGGDGDDASYRTKRYTFTRGERKGEPEDSWDAADRLVKEVGAYRWAAGNVFHAVSGDELRLGKPALTIRGDEGWLRRGPVPPFSWSSRRPIVEVTLDVLLAFWDVMPGGVVLLHRDLGPLSGRWLVFNVGGASLDSPEATITLRRPTALRAEPAPEVVQQSGGGEDGTIDVSFQKGSELRDICKYISDHRSDYLLGGGHGPKLATLKAGTRMDCSSSTSLALWRAGMMEGDVAQVSGWFASSWGLPGPGEEFTVWANAGHVFTTFQGPYGRFDTSQHSGDSGPAYTTVERSTAGFTPRHWRGH